MGSGRSRAGGRPGWSARPGRSCSAGRATTSCCTTPSPRALKRAREASRRGCAISLASAWSSDPHAVPGRIGYANGLAEALDGATYVQESTPERVEVKREVFAELDRLAAPDAVLASSTTGIPPSAFTEHLAGRQRCLVAHPINPPYVTPLVEICPAPWTDRRGGRSHPRADDARSARRRSACAARSRASSPTACRRR